MFLMFELMTIMFIVLFCAVTQAKRDIEQLEQQEQQHLAIEQLKREILDAEQQLRYPDVLQKSLQDYK